MKLRRLSREGKWQVLAACTERGNCPLEEFLCNLAPNFESSLRGILALLDYVAVNGPPRNVELSHQLRGDIYEFIKGRIRVLYFLERDRVIICTHGLVKKSQKIRGVEIERAEAVRRAYRTAVAMGKVEMTGNDDEVS